MMAWVMKMMVRRSKRSAHDPVQGRKSSCGPNCSDVTMPTSAAL